MKLKLLFLSISCFYLEISAWKIFHLGRSHGGNIADPELLTNYKLPPDQWFDQTLDHFNPTDERTWKQVSFRYSIGYTVPPGFSPFTGCNNDDIYSAITQTIPSTIKTPAARYS